MYTRSYSMLKEPNPITIYFIGIFIKCHYPVRIYLFKVCKKKTTLEQGLKYVQS